MNASIVYSSKTRLYAVESFLLAGLLSLSSWAQEAVPDSAAPASAPKHGWTYRSFSVYEIREHPARDLRSLLSLTPGFVALDADGGFYGRGSRNGQTDFRLNGIDIVDRFSNTLALPFIPEALISVKAHTGAYAASLGSAPGGLVELELRQGGDQWEVTAQHITDDFAATGSSFLGTYSYGQHTSVLTAGGPLPLDSRLFVAVEFHRMRDRAPRWVDPFSYELVTGPMVNPVGVPLPAPFAMKSNHFAANSLERSSGVWNLTSSAWNADLRFWGVLSSSRTRDADFYQSVRSYYRQQRLPWWDENRSILGLSASREVVSGVRVEATIVRDAAWAHTTDPDFGEEWRLYADSAANAQKGYAGFRERYYGPQGYFSVAELYFEHPSTPNDSYSKRSLGSWRAFVQATADVTDSWTLIVRGEAEWWTLRNETITSINGIRSLLDTDRNGVDDRIFADQRERDYYLRGSMTGYGYDTNMEPLDEGPYGARRPSFGAVIAESRIHEGPVLLNVGVRGVVWRTDAPIPLPAPTADGLWPQYPFDQNSFYADPAPFIPAPVTTHWLPRFSALVTQDRSEIYASWGKFISSIPQNELQGDVRRMSNLLLPYRYPPYSTSGSLLTSTARPEITTLADIGARWHIQDDLHFEAAAFTKSMRQQVQLGSVAVDTMAIQPVGYVNTGEGHVIGFESTLRWEPAPAVKLRLNYSFQQALGKTSTPRGNLVEFSDSPVRSSDLLYPLEYEQAHRCIAEIQFTAPPGSWADGFSAWAAGRLLSGHPYTKIAFPISYGAYGAWFVPVQSFGYPSSAVAEEPRNASVTPWTTSIDLSASYRFVAGPAVVRVLIAVTNVLNTKEIVNVYPTTRSATDDGWLTHEMGANALTYYANTPYAALYRDLNLKNRWAYSRLAGNDIYAAPRQLRLGIEVEL